jgi:redox-sensitive bicupin YhaK (pirin superfamily)
MIHVRKSHERGFADHGWLKSYHSFSFADYYDPRHMGWGNLRVINEDRIAPDQGFGAHPHRDMEIVSYVMTGALAHKDSMGNGTRIEPGDVQRMTAGTGVVHSEFNAADAVTHFLQIWILPSQRGLVPGYEQQHFEPESKRGQMRLVASPEGGIGGVKLNADARIYAGLLNGDEALTLTLPANRKGYLFLVKGDVRASGHELQSGDALLVEDEPQVEVSNARNAELIWFDLAP